MTVLQFTSLCLLLPFIRLLSIRRYLGSFLYGACFSSSIWVHRDVRDGEQDLIDDIDRSLAISCAVYSVVSLRKWFENYRGNDRIQRLVILLSMGIITWVLDYQRRLYDWRTFQRNSLHGCMHIIGGATAYFSTVRTSL